MNMTTAAALLIALLSPAFQDQDRIQKLIQSFSDASKDERSKAVEELAKIGRPAIEALQKAAKSSDLEVKGVAKWFPDARFYEVAAGAGGGQNQAMINMGMTPPKSLFAIRKYEEGF